MRREFRLLVLGDEVLSDLAIEVRSNAVEMIGDARLMLDAGRHARAHALAVLALEEAGKVCLCLTCLMHLITTEELLESWDSHTAKLTQSHLLALLYAKSYPVTGNVAEAMAAAVESDAALRLRGLYVDPSADGVVSPKEISAAQAAGMVRLSEELQGVLDELDLHGALERFRAPDAVAGRATWLQMREDMAAAASNAEALHDRERLAAEERLRASLDELVATLRSSLIERLP